jgi:hypothetical protein
MEEDGEPHAPITICYTNKCIASLDTWGSGLEW